MPKPRVRAAGGLAAVRYVFAKGREAGGVIKLYRRLRSKNTCKTCALGMGGQSGGMVNEAGHFPEICKKSVQAQAADMAGTISEEFLAQTSLAKFETLTSRQLEQLGRLTFPIVVDQDSRRLRRVTWDHAYGMAADALSGTRPERTFFYSSGRASNEAAFLLQLVARAYGTNNINNCSYYCHQASGVALSRVYGTGTASVNLEDLSLADLAVVAGANPACNHPRLITQLVNLRRRGGKVIVINPLRELGLVRFRLPSDSRSFLFGSQVSDVYLQPHIGGDLPLFMGLLKSLVESGCADTAFIAGQTAGWEAVRDQVRKADWKVLERASGVLRSQMEEAAGLLAGARSGIVCWAMGLTQQPNGTDTILALANIALARGWLGRKGAGFLPIRGHSNVQGVGSMGVAPELKAGFKEKLESLYGLATDLPPGQDTYASMLAAESGQVDAAVYLGGNLFGANPDRKWAARAMQKIGTSIYLTTKLNEGHIHGRAQNTLILPVQARDEESQSTTQESMFNFVRLSEGGEPAVVGEMKSEVEIIATLAERILPSGRFDWSRLRSHNHLREAMARVVPGYSPMSTLTTEGTEFQIEGRTYHQHTYQTADGKAHFHVTPMRATAGTDSPFRLMTLRSEGQFNTVVYEEEDLYRGNLHRQVVMMSGGDAGQLGLTEDDPVIVQTTAGQMSVRVSIVDIRAGNLAMYYPEANELVPQTLDPESKTPAFKFIQAQIIKV
jgi:molybdopterin-dependent oxidoreductase alpha subunit